MGKSLVEKLPGYSGIEFFKMKAEALYNKSKEQLKELGAETFDRITCSFYRYIDIESQPNLGIFSQIVE